MGLAISSLQPPNKVSESQEIYSQPLRQKDSTKSSPQKPDIDKYTRSEEDTAGLYQLGKDVDGNPKIIFDDPNQQKDKRDASQSEKIPDKESGGKRGEEKCTVNTDKVEAEIKRLKEKKQKLQQLINQALDDPVKQERLQRQLQQVDSEIRMKDNDAYKKQNAQYT